MEKKLLFTDDWNIVHPLVKMVKAKVAYDSRGTGDKIPIEFKNFLIDCIDSINEKEDFFAFTKYFEAVVGYYYGEGKVK